MSNKPKQEGQAIGLRHCYSRNGVAAGVVLTKGDFDTNNFELFAIKPSSGCHDIGGDCLEPRIFAGSLNDDELIAFLEEITVKLMSRKHLTGKPERLREEALAIEEKLNETNDLIDSVVVQRGQNSSRNL